MKEMTYLEAIREALVEEMTRDQGVITYGLDVRLGYAFGVTRGLVDKFGENRVFDTPMSEGTIVGSAIGCALMGLRPVVEIQFSDFLTLAMDQIVNQAAKIRFMSGGQVRVPMVIRSPFGPVGFFCGGPQHSQSLESWFLHVPGLKVAIPSNPSDAKGLLKTAIRDDNPVLFCEYKRLYSSRAPVPEDDYLIPFGEASIKRDGRDAMIVAMGSMVPKSIVAAEILKEEDGLDVLVLDLRTLVPLDKTLLLSCVERTKRVVIAEEDCLTGGIGAEIAAIIAEEGFDFLDAPVIRVAGMDAPIAAIPSLERYVIPDEKSIVSGIRKLFN